MTVEATIYSQHITGFEKFRRRVQGKVLLAEATEHQTRERWLA